MVANWFMVPLLGFIFVLGMFGISNPVVALGLVLLFLFSIIVISRFHPSKFQSANLEGALPADWILLALPTVVGLRALSAKFALAALALLVAAALLRKEKSRFRISAGPFVLLSISAAMVFIRPENTTKISLILFPILTFILVATLVIRIVAISDARRIIGSLIDGCGLYCLLSLVAYGAGLRSPAAVSRIGGLVESTGYVRIIYPFATSINIPPIIAAVYIAAGLFLLIEKGWFHRCVRLMYSGAALAILATAGTRLPVLAAALVLLIVIVFPPAIRGLTQGAVLFAAASALYLPQLLKSISIPLEQIGQLTPRRLTNTNSISSIQGRDEIWNRSITYWNAWVGDSYHRLFGFGMSGQYRSGASYSYSDLLAGISRSPERAFVHNSFLQQLFDGGILGWIIFALAIWWAGERLAKHRFDWGLPGISAIVATTVLVMSAITEVSIAPGPAQETFWILVVLVGVACQSSVQTVDVSGAEESGPSAPHDILAGQGSPAGLGAGQPDKFTGPLVHSQS